MILDDDKQLPLFKTLSETPDLEEQVNPAKTSPKTFSQYIVYVDESGDHSLQRIDEQYPIFVLAFCIFHKNDYCETIVPALEKFKFKHFGHDQIVLHENEIRKEKGAFNTFRSKQEKIQFLDALTDIIETSHFILISCTIDKRRLHNTGGANANPYHIALGICMESLYGFLNEKRQHEKLTHIVVECQGKKEDRDLELEFRRISDGNNRLGFPLPFKVIFSDKKAMSPGLQLADLVARPIGMNYLRPKQGNRAFKVLKKKFYCEDGRDHLGKDYKNVGMNIYPSLKSEKPR